MTPIEEDHDLKNEVYQERVGDLIRKLEETIHEAGYPPDEVLPALANLLVTRFTEAGDPDRMYRVFTVMLGREYDDLMDALEAEGDEDE